MTELPPHLRARREIEDQLVRLGRERHDLEARLAEIHGAIARLIPEATLAGIPLELAAKLVGVSRQTLYRWQEVARRPSEN